MAEGKSNPAAQDATSDPYRQLFDAAAIGIKWSMPDGRLVEVNHSFCNLFGIQALGIAGAPL